MNDKINFSLNTLLENGFGVQLVKQLTLIVLAYFIPNLSCDYITVKPVSNVVSKAVVC